MKPGDVYALDDGTHIMLCDEGGVLIDDTGVYTTQFTIDSDYLHSMRAVPVGNLKEALCQLSRSIWKPV
jgi:hypothetical protein